MRSTVFTWALLGAALALAQTAPPRFEVASVKPAPADAKGSSWNVRPGGLIVNNMTLKEIIQVAYGLQEYQCSTPGWLQEARYNIVAKPEAGATDGNQLTAMLRTLLAERFKLAIHRETKLVPGYALVVAKGGLKAKFSDSEGSSMKEGSTRFTGTGVNMSQLITWAARLLRQPVVDETGLTGKYNVTLDYANPQLAVEPGDPPSTLPSVFTALTEQAGLRLEGRKLPVEIIVVDHAERSSDN